MRCVCVLGVLCEYSLLIAHTHTRARAHACAPGSPSRLSCTPPYERTARPPLTHRYDPTARSSVLFDCVAVLLALPQPPAEPQPSAVHPCASAAMPQPQPSPHVHVTQPQPAGASHASHACHAGQFLQTVRMDVAVTADGFTRPWAGDGGAGAGGGGDLSGGDAVGDAGGAGVWVEAGAGARAGGVLCSGLEVALEWTDLDGFADLLLARVLAAGSAATTTAPATAAPGPVGSAVLPQPRGARM